MAEAVNVNRPFQYVGARVSRVEDPKFLRGRGKYTDDLELPNCLHAAFVRSPYAHAKILGINSEEALKLPGVTAVFTGEDLKDHVGPLMANFANKPGTKEAAHHPIPTDKARHVGDPVAVVLADSRYTAEDGAALVEVDWEPLPTVVDPEKSLAGEAPVIDENIPDNNFAHYDHGVGDVDSAFASAAHVFSKRFITGRTTAAPLEPRAVMAEYEPTTGRVQIWCSSQMPHLLRTLIAPVLKISESKIAVIADDVGGGFGMKCHVFVEDVVIPALSKLTGRGVKWVGDRYEDLSASCHAKNMIVDLELATAEDGSFLGLRGHFISDAGAYAISPHTPLVDTAVAAMQLPGMYDVGDLHFTVDAPFTNKCHLGAVRGVGWTSGQLARETLIDEVARELKIDPVELRLKNVLSSEPQTLPLGSKLDGNSFEESLRRAAETLDYENFRVKQETLRKEGKYLGIGFSPFVEPTGLGNAQSQSMGLAATFHDRSSVSVEPDGSVVVTTGLHSHGQGHETTLAQVAADELGVRIEDVRVMFGDTEQSVYGSGTYASRSAVIGTGTIRLASADVREKLLSLAGKLFEASPEDVELYDGKASLKGAPAKTIPISEIAGFGYFGAAARPEETEDHTLASTRSYDPPETHANGCYAVIVEVDVDTGIVKVERIVAVEDCGVMLNPMIVEGQVAGAVAQGVGLALLEDLAYDEDGQFLSGSLMDYLYPTTAEIPSIDMVHIETPSTVSEGGVKGMGEAGMISTPAAVVNAVADALSPFGVKIDHTPVTPSYILDLLRDARS